MTFCSEGICWADLVSMQLEMALLVQTGADLRLISRSERVGLNAEAKSCGRLRKRWRLEEVVVKMFWEAKTEVKSPKGVWEAKKVCKLWRKRRRIYNIFYCFSSHTLGRTFVISRLLLLLVNVL